MTDSTLVKPIYGHKFIVSDMISGETFELMLDRWEKLNKDFYNPSTELYDLSKVPDIYGNLVYAY